jgi:hypothetical protein
LFWCGLAVAGKQAGANRMGWSVEDAIAKSRGNGCLIDVFQRGVNGFELFFGKLQDPVISVPSIYIVESRAREQTL